MSGNHHRKAQTHWGPLLSFILGAWLVTALYAVGLQFPFYSDDVTVFAHIQSAAFGQMWTEPDVFNTYYRPLTYSAFYPRWPAWSFYALSLFTHVVNMALLSRLLRGLRAPVAAQIVGPLLFGLFAFSAQAVLWIAAYGHLLGLTCWLLAAVASLRYLARGSLGSLVAALVAGCAAPFAHENGVLTVPLLALLVAYRFPWRVLLHKWRRVLLLSVPLASASVSFWVLRGALLNRPTQFTSEHLASNALVTLQWLTFPTQWLGALLPNTTQQQQVLIGALPLAVLALVTIWRRAEQRRLLLVGLGLAVVAALPAAVLLHAAYFAWGERLLYWSAVGGAMAYSAVLLAVPQRWRYATLTLIITISIAIVVPYRADMRVHNAIAQDVLAAFADEQANAAPAGEWLFLNLPAHSERPNPLLPLTPTRAFMFSDWIFLDAFVRVNGYDPVRPLLSVQAPQLYPTTWPTGTLAFHGRLRDAAMLADEVPPQARVYALADATALRVRLIGEQVPPSSTSAAVFGEVLALDAMTAQRVGDTVQVALDWRRLHTETTLPQIAFVHLLCDGAIIAQDDAAPLWNAHPFAAWAADEAWRDWRYLSASGADDACLAVRVGLYNPADGARLLVTAGAAVDAEWLVFPITVMP